MKENRKKVKQGFDLMKGWLTAHIAHRKRRNGPKTVAPVGMTLLMVSALAVVSAFVGQRNAAASGHMYAAQGDHMVEIALNHMAEATLGHMDG